MQIFCYFPSVCIDPSADISPQVREQLLRAIAAELKPVKVPRGTEGQPVRLPDDLRPVLDTLSERHQMAPGRAVGGLMYALYLQKNAEASANLHTDVVVPVTDKLRQGQIRCLLEATPLLKAGNLIAAECGTGSGKSRLIAHAAAYVLELRDAKQSPQLPPDMESEFNASGLEKAPGFIREFGAQAQSIWKNRLLDLGLSAPRSVIVSAPSVENVSHLCKEWAQVRGAVDPQRRFVTAIVLGRGQFVSASQLQTMLDESESEHPQIRKWLEQGMPAGRIPATKSIKAIQPQIHSLMADLEALSLETDFPCNDAQLDEDSPAEEHGLYRLLRDAAMTADLVFTTHAMLCMDNLRLATQNAGPLLPPPLAMFVDEAHLLEPIQSAVAAKSLSFMRLLSMVKAPEWTAMRKAQPAATAVARAKECIEKLIAIPHETPLPVSRTGNEQILAAWNRAVPGMRELEIALLSLTKVSDKKASQLTVTETKAMRYARRALAALQQIAKDYKGHIEHSPRRGAISFVVGPSNVDRYLFARWVTTPCAMMLSGTLHFVGSDGADYEGFFSEMCLPVTRGKALTPMHPEWATSTPTMMLPHNSIYHRLIPPTGEDINDLSLAAWLLECARVVNIAASDAAGGMLVLLTSFERLDGLKAAIEAKHPKLATRLIAQTPSSRLAKNIPVFKGMARNGQKPIWLAVGSAWVGLDLADELVPDEEAHNDLLLTDLIIPNVPFGMSRTTTHVSRISRLGFGVEAVATQRLFRQGLGRLIRRQGLVKRRIWILDGRLMHPASATYTRGLNRVLSPYLKRADFKI